VQFKVDAYDIHRLWLGKYNLPIALRSAGSAVAGPIHRLAAVLDAFGAAEGRYLTHLYSLGRPDFT
jgi:hypothetical protein